MYAESVIYVLIDPRDQEIRYVGKTNQTLNRRLSDHLRKDRSSGSHKENWIAQLDRSGYRPIIQPVQVVLREHWKSAEQYWIGYFRSIGCDLTNGTLGGDGGNRPTPEALARLSASKTGVKRPPFSEQWRKRMSDSAKARSPRTPETREKIAASKRGVKREPFSAEWRFKLGAHERNMTHCKRGHEFTPENTRRDKQGKRYCRACDAIRAQTYRDRRQIKI